MLQVCQTSFPNHSTVKLSLRLTLHDMSHGKRIFIHLEQRLTNVKCLIFLGGKNASEANIEPLRLVKCKMMFQEIQRNELSSQENRN